MSMYIQSCAAYSGAAKTGSALPALQRERQLRSSAFTNQNDNLSLRCFSRKSKNCSFSRLVPSLLHMLHHGGRWSGAFKSGRQPVFYSDLPFARILCPAVPFKTAPALECFLPNISNTVCFPIRRALLRLAPGSTLPALQRECQLRSSAFPNQTDNRTLRCFNRKSKNYSFSKLVPSLLRHGGSKESASWEAQPFPTKPTIQTWDVSAGSRRTVLFPDWCLHCYVMVGGDEIPEPTSNL